MTNRKSDKRNEEQPSDKDEIVEIPLADMDDDPEEWEEVLRIQPEVEPQEDLGTEQCYKTQRHDT